MKNANNIAVTFRKLFRSTFGPPLETIFFIFIQFLLIADCSKHGLFTRESPRMWHDGGHL